MFYSAGADTKTGAKSHSTHLLVAVLFAISMELDASARQEDRWPTELAMRRITRSRRGLVSEQREGSAAALLSVLHCDCADGHFLSHVQQKFTIFVRGLCQ